MVDLVASSVDLTTTTTSCCFVRFTTASTTRTALSHFWKRFQKMNGTVVRHLNLQSYHIMNGPDWQLTRIAFQIAANKVTI